MRGKKCRFPNSSIQLLSLFSLYVVSSSLQPHGAHEAPLSMGFPRQEYWSGLPFPSPGNLPNPRIKPMFLLDRWILYHWATWEAPFTQSWHYFVIWGLRVTPFIFFLIHRKSVNCGPAKVEWGCLPGHTCILHLDTWVASPGQGRPLLDGIGLLHSRFRVFSPPPQEVEHQLQLCQFPQLPSTVNKNETVNINKWVIKSTPRVTLPIWISFQDLKWWGCYKEHWMKGFTCSPARGWEAHQDTCPCCISGSGSLGPHTLFLHWRDEGYHMCGTAASAPHYMSGCIFPSHSKDSSYHELRHRTIGEVVNNDIHPKSTERLYPGSEKKHPDL